MRAKKHDDSGKVNQVSGLRSLNYDAAYDFEYVPESSDTVTSEIA